MIITPVTSKSKVVTAVTATAASFSAGMVAGSSQFWRFVSTTNCWILQGATPTAVANTVGNMLVPAGQEVYLDGRNGADVSVVRDTADGHASLTPVTTY